MSKDLRSNHIDALRGFRRRVGQPISREVLVLCVFARQRIRKIAYRYAMNPFSQAEPILPCGFADSVLLGALSTGWLGCCVTVYSGSANNSTARPRCPPNIPLWFLLNTCSMAHSVKGLVVAVVLRRFLRNPTRLRSRPLSYRRSCWFRQLRSLTSSRGCDNCAVTSYWPDMGRMVSVEMP